MSKKLKSRIKKLENRIVDNLKEHVVTCQIHVRALSDDEAADIVQTELLANPNFCDFEVE